MRSAKKAAFAIMLGLATPAFLAGSLHVLSESASAQETFFKLPPGDPTLATSKQTSSLPSLNNTASLDKVSSENTRAPQKSSMTTAIDTRGAVVLSSRTFQIPFNVDKGPRPVEVRLFMARGAKSKWDLLARKSPTANQFQFNSTTDGVFWFATRTVDASGAVHPADQLEPQLKVVIDTTKPTVTLQADADPTGRVSAILKHSDTTPIKSVQIHYATDAHRQWTSIKPTLVKTDGSLTFMPKENWQQLSLQVIMVDSANNKSVETKLVRRPRVAAAPKPKYAEKRAAQKGSVDATLIVGPATPNDLVYPAAKPQQPVKLPTKVSPRTNSVEEIRISLKGKGSVVDGSTPVERIAQIPAVLPPNSRINNAQRVPAAPRGQINPFVQGNPAQALSPAPGVNPAPLTGPAQQFKAPPISASPTAPPPTGSPVVGSQVLGTPTAPQRDPRSLDPKSLTMETAPHRAISIGGAVPGLQSIAPPQQTPTPMAQVGQPFAPPSLGVQSRYPAATANQPLPSAAQPQPSAAKRHTNIAPVQPNAALPQTSAALPQLTTTGPTPVTPRATPPQIGSGIANTNQTPAVQLPTGRTPVNQGLTMPGISAALPPTMPRELAMPNQLSAPDMTPNSPATKNPPPLGSDFYPANVTQEKKKRTPPRTAKEATRPIQANDTTFAAKKTQTEDNNSAAAKETPEYRALRQSQSNYDRAMLAGRAPIRYSDSNRFSLEYELEAVGAGGAESVELYGSTDGGRTWQRWGTDPDVQSPFDIETKDDGTFAFKIVVVSRNGLASPRPLPQDSPDIVVVVDQVQPKIRLTDALFGEGNRSGSLIIRYECEDAHLMQRPIALSFSDTVEGPWTTIAAGLLNDGEYIWPGDPELPRQIYLRIDAKDRAGNIGTYVLKRPIDSRGLAPRARIRGFRSLSGANVEPFQDSQTATRPSDTESQPRATFK